jgi:5-methyltetrahydropteroyltriglutamate--homocysteine methyltransferase
MRRLAKAMSIFAAMKRSNDHILTTHAGSLRRPVELTAIQEVIQAGEAYDSAAYGEALKAAVAGVVRRQVELGITVVNDGEMSKIGTYTGYVRSRLHGYDDGDTEPRPVPGVADDYPDWQNPGWANFRTPKWLRALGHQAVSWKDFSACETDIDNFAEALKSAPAEDAFMPSSSPGTIANHNSNTYYASRRDYLEALGEVMRREYEAVVAAGFVLQIDCPDLAAARDNFYSHLSVAEFRKIAAENIEVLNHATRNIPPDSMRIHVCWGANAGPHTRDIEMRDIQDIILTARPAGLSFVAANSRHEWEYELWRDVKLPEGKILIPGVIDSTTTMVEHPETVAGRIVRFAEVVGPENIIAGVDCGFGYALPASITWAKLKALGDGARIATQKLFA